MKIELSVICVTMILLQILCFRRIFPSGSIYNEKRTGLNTDPCGTPQSVVAMEERKMANIYWESPVTEAGPKSGQHIIPQAKHMLKWWCSVSNVALRSNRSRTAQLPESTASSSSSVTFIKADSVLWKGLKPDSPDPWCNLSAKEYFANECLVGYTPNGYH